MMKPSHFALTDELFNELTDELDYNIGESVHRGLTIAATHTELRAILRDIAELASDDTTAPYNDAILLLSRIEKRLTALVS